jgi:hypothetical protein
MASAGPVVPTGGWRVIAAAEDITGPSNTALEQAGIEQPGIAVAARRAGRSAPGRWTPPSRSGWGRPRRINGRADAVGRIRTRAGADRRGSIHRSG